MKNRPIIHKLVQSLTKNEKGYFIKQLSTKESNYGKLFQLLSAQKAYNEDLIIAEFKDSYIGNNYAFAKNYLYHSILKSLIKYNSNKKDAYYYFASVKILYQKGLYDQSAKILKQIVKKANSVDDYLSILRVIQYTKLLVHSNLHTDQELLDLVDQESKILGKQQTVSTFQTLLAEVKNLRIKKGGLKEKDSMARLRQIISHDFLLNEDHVIDRYCEHMYHETLFLCGFLLQDAELTEMHILPLQRMITDENYSKNLNGYRKIDLLKQLIRYNILNKNYPSAQDNMQALHKLLDTSTDINKTEMIAAYSYLYSFQTDLLLNQKEVTDAQAIFVEIEDFITKNKAVIPQEFFIVIRGNILVLRFMMGDYREVLQLTNELFTTYTKNIRKDIVISTMLAEIAVLYELNKIQLLESRLDSFNRYLVTNKVNEISWKFFSEFFQNMLKNKDVSTSASILIMKIEKLESNRIILDLEFLIDWIRTKIKQPSS